MANKVVVKVKQGEEFNLGFTIKENGSPLDLSEYDNIRFQVKKAPLLKFEPIIDKVITEYSDINTVGQITSAGSGQVVVHLSKEDTSFPPSDYYLIISLQAPHLNYDLSSTCCCNGIYRICEQ